MSNTFSKPKQHLKRPPVCKSKRPPPPPLPEIGIVTVLIQDWGQGVSINDTQPIYVLGGGNTVNVSGLTEQGAPYSASWVLTDASTLGPAGVDVPSWPVGKDSWSGNAFFVDGWPPAPPTAATVQSADSLADGTITVTLY
jgi:hypothetical protein